MSKVIPLLFSTAVLTQPIHADFSTTEATKISLAMQVAAFVRGNANDVKETEYFTMYSKKIADNIAIAFYDMNNNGCVDSDDSLGKLVDIDTGTVIITDEHVDGLQKETSDFIIYFPKNSVHEERGKPKKFAIDDQAIDIFNNVLKDISSFPLFKQTDVSHHYCTITPKS